MIIAAPFSAIMIVGALVLVEVTAGITAPFDERIPGPLAETVPEFVKRLISES